VGRVRCGRLSERPGVTARFTIGADGARSTVARRLVLDVSRRFLVGVEEVFPVTQNEGAPTFHCVLDPAAARLLIDDGSFPGSPHAGGS
jgi:flavin-dependent dehydrogenase